MLVSSDDIAKQAADHLSRHDPQLAPVIAAHGLCTIRPHRNYYHDLVESIIGQQLSIKAANTIVQRFKALFGDTMPTPKQLLAADHDTLRSVGLSNQKANYIRDLAQHIQDGRLQLTNLETLSNQEIIDMLVAVKGIGEWTAHMFLMFCMARSDILAHGDLGIRNGVRKLYNIKQNPSPDDLKAIAKRYQWHPYQSVACWYIWRSLDNAPK